MMHARLTINVRFDGAISYCYRYPGTLERIIKKRDPRTSLPKARVTERAQVALSECAAAS